MVGPSSPRSTSASARTRRTLSGIASGTHPGMRICPVGPTIEAMAWASWIAGSERSPPQLPEWCPRIDPQVEGHTAAGAEKDGRAPGRKTRPVRADEHVRAKALLLPRAKLAQAGRA